MNLSQNGRIVIIDDNFDEVKPIIKVLSKERIPFNYYSGKNSTELPDDPEANPLRILFLDLNIFEPNTIAKNIISPLKNILDKFIPSRPNPYILIVWSKEGDDYKKELDELLNSEFSSRYPAKIIFLDKIAFIKFEDGKWVEEDDCLPHLREKIFSELSNVAIVRNMISWENIVHDCTCSALNEISEFYPINDDWNQNMKGIFYKLAKAHIGNDRITQIDDEKIVKEAFVNINKILFDCIESNIHDKGLGKVEPISEQGITEEVKVMLNSKIHSVRSNFTPDSFSPGDIYVLPLLGNQLQQILIPKSFKNDLGKINDSFPWLIELDITPSCDYSQDKNYVRTVLGIAISDKVKINKKGLPQYLYLTPTLKLHQHNRFMLFDFRMIKSWSKDEIMNRKIRPSLRLRKELCTDIQTSLSNHVNRPGVSVVE